VTGMSAVAMPDAAQYATEAFTVGGSSYEIPLATANDSNQI